MYYNNILLYYDDIKPYMINNNIYNSKDLISKIINKIMSEMSIEWNISLTSFNQFIHMSENNGFYYLSIYSADKKYINEDNFKFLNEALKEIVLNQEELSRKNINNERLKFLSSIQEDILLNIKQFNTLSDLENFCNIYFENCESLSRQLINKFKSTMNKEYKLF